MFEIDRERKIVWAVAPNGLKIECCSVSNYRSIFYRDAYYYARLRHEANENDEMITRIPEPGSEESKTPEAAFEALIKYLGLTEHEQPAEAKESDEVKQLKRELNVLTKITHDMTVANQAAWIEWQHGCGAEAAMQWVENGLCGPGFIPDEDGPYGKEAQAYYDANKYEPFPFCYCGRPSNILSGSEGFCCEEHLDSRRAQTETHRHNHQH